MPGVYMKRKNDTRLWFWILAAAAGWALALVAAAGMIQQLTRSPRVQEVPVRVELPVASETRSAALDASTELPPCDDVLTLARILELEVELEKAQTERTEARQRSREYKRGLDEAVKQLNIMARRPQTVIEPSPRAPQRRKSRPRVFAHLRGVVRDSSSRIIVEGWLHNKATEEVSGELEVILTEVETGKQLTSTSRRMSVGPLTKKDFLVDVGIFMSQNVSAEARFFPD